MWVSPSHLHFVQNWVIINWTISDGLHKSAQSARVNWIQLAMKCVQIFIGGVFAVWTIGNRLKQPKDKPLFKQWLVPTTKNTNCLVQSFLFSWLICQSTSVFNLFFFNNQSYHLKINWWDKTITLPWVSGVPSTLARLIWNKASVKWEAPQLYTGKAERQSFKLGFLSTSCLFSLPGAYWDPDNSTLAEKMLFTEPYGEHGPQDYLIGWQGYNGVIAITKNC